MSEFASGKQQLYSENEKDSEKQVRQPKSEDEAIILSTHAV